MSFSSLKTPSLSELGNGLVSLFIIQRDSSGTNSSAAAPSAGNFSGASSAGTESLVVRRESRPSGNSSGGSNSSNKNNNSVSKEKEDVSSVVAEILLSIVLSGAIYAVGIGIWNLSRTIAKALTGNDSEDVDQIKSSAVHRLTKLLEKRGRALDKPLRLSSHESHMAEDIIDPDDMDSCFKDIGGLDHLKQEIWELAVLPLLRPDLFRGRSKLVQQPSGILLYGKPGTGKTMLAKAVAKEGQAVFIPIKLSKILNKWVGESNKLVTATFSLARKLAPSIIFIDELDTFLSDTVDPSASKSMESVKSEFLTEWDGISTNRQHAPVLVLGATNRPHLLDPAILRRLPRSFEVPLPNAKGREQIIRVLFDGEELDHSAQAFLTTLAQQYTQGYSGSDLKELCKAAAMEPVHEVTAEEARKAVMGETSSPRKDRNRKKKKRNTKANDLSSSERSESPKMRKISEKDLRVALSKVRRTGQSAREYGANMAYERAHGTDPQSPQSVLGEINNIDPRQLQQMMTYLQNMLAQNGDQSNHQNGGNGDYDGDIGDVPPPQSE